MICEKTVKKFCKDNISLIENYEQAVNDKTQTWDCHHRLELTLDVDFAHSLEDMKRLGMYYHRPHFELIFLPHGEHVSMHHKALAPEARAKISSAMTGENHPMYGKHHSPETRAKMSAERKGENHPMYGKKHGLETIAKISEARRKYWAKLRNQKSDLS